MSCDREQVIFLFEYVIVTYELIIFVQLGAFDRGRGWSGGAMVLGKLPVPGRPTI